jgi:hypothetical protein
VRNENAPAFCIERAVVEGAAGGIRYRDSPDGSQRHDRPAAPSLAQTTIGEGETGI